jgi:oligopeptide/dipeptide ABC transporter ATP-binding protein
LVEPTSGEILFAGESVRGYSKSELFTYRKNAQIVYQDPYQFLDPRRTIGETLAEPMEIHRLYSKAERDAKVLELLDSVGLSHEYKDRYPHELSGGQKQRIGIARAISLNPKIIVADEPVSALDVSVQAQVLNLFQDLKVRLGLSYLFISHDLSVVRNIADRVAVMYFGKIVEIGDPDSLFRLPVHPYTKALLSAVPQHEVASTKERITLQGEVASQTQPTVGCSFHNHCPFAMEQCRTVEPTLREIEPDRFVACHL